MNAHKHNILAMAFQKRGIHLYRYISQRSFVNFIHVGMFLPTPPKQNMSVWCGTGLWRFECPCEVINLHLVRIIDILLRLAPHQAFPPKKFPASPSLASRVHVLLTGAARQGGSETSCCCIWSLFHKCHMPFHMSQQGFFGGYDFFLQFYMPYAKSLTFF